MVRRCAVMLVVLVASIANATTYEVGPSKPLANVGDVPWEALSGKKLVVKDHPSDPTKRAIAVLSRDALIDTTAVTPPIAGGRGQLRAMDAPPPVECPAPPTGCP